MYKYLFGPVPSRRLGMSLGVDLIPRKVCSFNCVYCEVGKTTNLTTERKEYVLYDEVIYELDHYFKNNPDPDYITFSGSGEPLLNSRIGDVLDYIKEKRPDIPVAVLTNGSLFYNPEVRKELLKADVVLPSLDAATEETFKKINIPAHNISLKNYIKGLVEFRKEFKGKIWLEIFILPDYNLNNKDLDALKSAILEIKPDMVQLNTLDRPGVIPGLKPANHKDFEYIITYWGLDNIKIISSVQKRKNILSYRKDAENAILETIARRPCTIDDLSRILGMHVNEINKYIDVLESDGKIQTVRQTRGIFYQLKE